MVKLKQSPEFKDGRQLPSKGMLTAIGRAVVISASIEDILHGIHWKYAGLSQKVGPVITGDARATRLTEDIMRIVRAAKVRYEIIDDLHDIFEELKLLITKRNKCIHWLWEKPKGRRHKISPPIYKVGHSEAVFSVKEIEALGDALVWIEARLSAHEMSDDDLRKERERFGEKAHIFVPTPWLDKPQTPNPTPSKPLVQPK